VSGVSVTVRESIRGHMTSQDAGGGGSHDLSGRGGSHDLSGRRGGHMTDARGSHDLSGRGVSLRSQRRG